jgi:hypothetical protein
MIKNHLKHNWYGFKTYKPCSLVIFTSFRVNHSSVFLFDWVETMFCRYECGHGPEDHCEDPNHMKSIKHDHLAHFSIKRFYTRPNVLKITFYHRTHIWTNEDPIHGACDPRSTSRMLAYAPHMSHKLKEFIWTQLGLGYTVKQIYDKHKEIWWERANAGEQMTHDHFLWF